MLYTLFSSTHGLYDSSGTSPLMTIKIILKRCQMSSRDNIISGSITNDLVEMATKGLEFSSAPLGVHQGEKNHLCLSFSYLK